MRCGESFRTLASQLQYCEDCLVNRKKIKLSSVETTQFEIQLISENLFPTVKRWLQQNKKKKTLR